MSGLEYWFGTGDGTTHTWFSEPDLSLGGGDFDAVAIDFDGDGLLDDAMWDRDRDGVVDMAVLDRDTAPQHYTDPSRRGVWDGAVDATHSPSPRSPWPDPPSLRSPWPDPPSLRSPWPDPPSLRSPWPAGSPGVEWTDRDGATQHAAGDRAPIDYDGDGHETDAVLDVDHDGHADAILIGGEPNRFRALYPLPDLGAVDTDGDGILDAITTDAP